MFRIGEFSRLVRVSPRMLRHYEKCGMIVPAEIDPFTGYRGYSAGQIPLLSKIVSLRDVGFSIDEITEILPRYDDAAYLDRMLQRRAEAVKHAMAAEQEKLDKIAEMSNKMRKERNTMLYDVELKSLPSVKVLSLRGVIPAYNQEGLLWEKLSGFVMENGIECVAGGYSIYYDEEYKEADVDVEIALPVKNLGESKGEFVFRELEAVPMAATVRFSGPYDGGYDAASEKLAEWMESSGYGFAGNMRGQVIVGYDKTQDPSQFLTELQVPVVKRD